MSFDTFSFDPRINAGIAAAGYTAPTPIQQQAIPAVSTGADVLGLAQTGTGKTAAFLLPMLQRLSSGGRRGVRALIIAPTRELASQIHDSCRTLSRELPLRSVVLFGGCSKVPQAAALRRGAEIVVACPGRLLDLLNDRSIDLSRVEMLVLDEADHMCDMGFLPDIRRILGRLPTERQTLFFSATMPPEIRALANDILRSPVTVQVDSLAPAQSVAHALYPVPEGLKRGLLQAMLSEKASGRTLVFTRTKYRARSLAAHLEKQGYRVAALQGNMTQNRRKQAIEGFRKGSYDILVATDIVARGIDVAGISHVINFDMPDTVEAYTHRIGRTGRASATGDAYTLSTPEDESLVRAIERSLNTRIERRRLEGFDYGAPAERPERRPRGPQPQHARTNGRREHRHKPAGSRSARPGRARHRIGDHASG